MAGLRGFLASNWQLLLLVLVVFLLWHQPVAMPLRLLVVLFHEASHALAAILTGGRVEALTLNAAEGGHALVAGGNFFVIASAGYLGSLAIGLVILAVSLRTGVDRGALAALGAGILILAALYVREAFALAFCLAVAAAFLAIARYLPAIWSDLVLRIIGLTSLFYVPYDIFSDTLARSHLRSDARILAEHYGGATLLWGGLWLLVSLAAIAYAARLLMGADTHLWRPKRK